MERNSNLPKPSQSGDIRFAELSANRRVDHVKPQKSGAVPAKSRAWRKMKNSVSIVISQAQKAEIETALSALGFLLSGGRGSQRGFGLVSACKFALENKSAFQAWAAANTVRTGQERADTGPG